MGYVSLFIAAGLLCGDPEDHVCLQRRSTNACKCCRKNSVLPLQSVDRTVLRIVVEAENTCGHQLLRVDRCPAARTVLL